MVVVKSTRKMAGRVVQSPKRQFKLVSEGTSFIIHLQPSYCPSDCPHIIVSLLVRFEEEIGESYHLLSIAIRMHSVINNKHGMVDYNIFQR